MNIGNLIQREKILALLLLFCIASLSINAFGSDDSKHRLLGTDQNRDGIRDDVEAQIDAKFSGEINKQMRLMAAKFQLILSGALSYQEINNLIEDIGYLNSCIQNTTKDENVGSTFLKPIQLNTLVRIRTYLKASAAAYDESGPPNIKSCDSDTDAIDQ